MSLRLPKRRDIQNSRQHRGQSSVGVLASDLLPLAASYLFCLRPVPLLCPGSATWILSLWNQVQLSARWGWRPRGTFYLATSCRDDKVFHLCGDKGRREDSVASETVTVR